MSGTAQSCGNSRLALPPGNRRRPNRSMGRPRIMLPLRAITDPGARPGTPASDLADDTPEDLAARAGKPRFIATLRRNGHSTEEICNAFGGIAQAQSVKHSDGAGPNELLVEVVPKGNDDLRAEIFQAAVSANLVLLGLEQHGENLEDVFRQLTTGNAGAAQ